MQNQGRMVRIFILLFFNQLLIELWAHVFIISRHVFINTVTMINNRHYIQNTEGNTEPHSTEHEIKYCQCVSVLEIKHVKAKS